MQKLLSLIVCVGSFFASVGTLHAMAPACQGSLYTGAREKWSPQTVQLVYDAVALNDLLGEQIDLRFMVAGWNWMQRSTRSHFQVVEDIVLPDVTMTPMSSVALKYSPNKTLESHLHLRSTTEKSMYSKQSMCIWTEGPES